MKRFVTQMSLCIAAAVFATGCTPVRHNLPPEQRLLEPGPGVGGPGPGVITPPAMAPGPMAGAGAAAGVVPAGYCGPDGAEGGAMGGAMMGVGMMAPPTVQVTFGQPESMLVRYSISGSGMFDSEPLVVPARQNFPQGGLYRLKLTNIPGREGVELYPTLELAVANPRTGAYLAHNAIPVQFTEEDLDQVLTGNFVTKVIYLPDPDFQGPALAGIDTLVSTRLDPGVDPIVEADRRGAILAIIRLGDKDIEMAQSLEMQGVVGEGAAPMGATAGLPVPFAPCSTTCGGGGGGNGAPLPPQMPGMVAGMTAPQYGMPYTGTPIGLPGPPHIPLGAPAGLKKHVMKNHTHMNIPQPVDKVKIGVRQAPGYSYPNPVSRVHISEQNINPGVPYGRPHYYKASQNANGTLP